MVTVPVLLFVRVVLAAGVTLPPKVMALAPASDWFAEKAAAPVPLLKVLVVDAVMPPPKLVTGFWPERFHDPPLLIVTDPVNVLVPVAAVTVLTVPVIDEVPEIVNANPPILSVEPVPTERFPVTVLPAPVVMTAVPLMFKLPPMVVITGVAVTEPLMLKSVPIVVTLPILAAPLPVKPKVL